MFLKLFRQCSKSTNTNFRIFRQNHQNTANWNTFNSKETPTKTLTSSQQQQQQNDQPNLLIENIQRANNSAELLNIIGLNRNIVTKENVLQAFRTLFILQKVQKVSSSSSNETTTIHRHPEFEFLCRNLNKNIRSLELNDTIDILKILIFLDVPIKSTISLSLVNLIRHQINDLQLGHIVFLDFLFKKVEQIPLIESLKLALPLLLQIKLNDQLDHENLPQLLELLNFIAVNPVSEQCKMNVISSLTIHGKNLNVADAKQIIWSLIEMQNGYKHDYDKLLHICINIIENNLDQLDYYQFNKLFGKIIDRFSFKYVDVTVSFYNEKFYAKCVDHFIKNDYGFLNAVYLQKKFNKINYVDINLLKYIANKASENPIFLINAKTNILFSFVTGFSMANFKPKNWETLQLAIFKNEILQQQKTSVFPWIKFAVELLSLDIYNEELIKEIFNDEFLEKYLLRQKSSISHMRLDYLQLLQLHQSICILKPQYNGPFPNEKYIKSAIEINTFKTNELLQKCLEVIVGGGTDYIISNVKSKYGHFIDHAILYNLNEKRFAKYNDVSSKDLCYFDDLNNIDGYQAIAVLVLPKQQYCLNIPRLKGIFDINIRIMEIMGFSVVHINTEQWLTLPDHEKIPYIQREINSKLL